MKLHKHFLPQDLEQASREFWCLKDLLLRISIDIENGEVEKAKHRSVDLTKSLHELSRLADKKYEMDKVNKLVEKMGSSGINLQIVRSILHE